MTAIECVETIRAMRAQIDAMRDALRETVGWIEYAHKGECRSVPDSEGNAHWACDCGRDAMEAKIRAALATSDEAGVGLAAGQQK